MLDKRAWIGVDRDRYYDCNGQAFPFINPGIWDLENYKFNDIISSYRCEELGGLD